ncbi:orotidine-5'-phosphate decarboxylase [bacterium]|nr:orotidine-5'-phosphate decarboxylase [bacterium]
MNIKQKIETAVKESGGYLCVGLDLNIKRLPEPVKGDTPDELIGFNRSIIESTVDFTAAYKLNLAFYEALGEIGFYVLKGSIDCIPKDRLIIADGKRGDIGSSAAKYAEAIFDKLGADMATVNPYMGYDAVEPFISRKDKGAFILTLTSNPGASDFQLQGEPQMLFESIASKVVEWNVSDNIGLIVGATQQDYIARVRSIAPELPLLIPGIGAQGGDLERAVSGTMVEWDGISLINSSRGIIYASSGKDFAEAAASAAKKLRDSINQILKKYEQK